MRRSLAVLLVVLAAAPAASQQHGTWEPGLGAGGSGADTTCLDPGVACLFAGAAAEGGPATTALALAAAPDLCPAGQWSGGIDAAGDAQQCTPDDDVPESGDFAAAAALEADGSLSIDTVGLPQLAGCPGPGEIVEYGASGVPACIATPSGGGGTPGGSDREVQVNDGGAFVGATGLTWEDSAEELTIRGRTDAASERVAVLSGPDRATPANGDTAYLSLVSEWPAQFREAARLSWTTNANDGSQSSKFEVGVNLMGTLTPGLMVSSMGLSVPAVSFPAGTSSTPGINFYLGHSGADNDGCYLVSNGIMACVSNGVESFRWQQGLFVVPSTGLLNFSTDTGLARDGAAGRLRVTNGSTGTGSILYGAEIASPAARTCTSSGDASPGSLSVAVSGTSYAEVTNSDPDGCTAVLSESGAVRGQSLAVAVTSTAGGTVAFADSAGVQETGAGCSLGENGVAVFRYATTDRWLLESCQPTN